MPRFQIFKMRTVFQRAGIQSTIADWKANDPLRYDAWLQDEKSIIQAAKERMYFNLVKGGVTATLAEGKLDYTMANDKVDIKYVRIPYTTFQTAPSQFPKVRSKHTSKITRPSFSKKTPGISDLCISRKASAEDDASVKEAITALLDDSVEYSEAKDANDTIAGFRNTSDMLPFWTDIPMKNLDTIYKAKKDLPSVVADTLMAMEVGEVYGPYKDGDFYKVSKVMDRKENGTVKASHILISWEGAERANPAVTRTQRRS